MYELASFVAWKQKKSICWVVFTAKDVKAYSHPSFSFIRAQHAKINGAVPVLQPVPGAAVQDQPETVAVVVRGGSHPEVGEEGAVRPDQFPVASLSIATQRFVPAHVFQADPELLSNALMREIGVGISVQLSGQVAITMRSF